jgi:hypothetical protein
MRTRSILLSIVGALAVSGAASPQTSPPTPKPAAPRAPVARPTPPPPPVLEGVVRGPDRQPIQNALVVAVASARTPDDFSPAPPAAVWVRTDAAGRFRLPLRTRAPHTVRVESPGLAAATRRGAVAGAPLAFDLTAGGAIEGTVRDGDSGAPVADVRVVARGDAIPVPELPDVGRVVTRTDANGRFRLQGLASGRFTVSAGGRGRGTVSRNVVRTGDRVDLVLFPAGSIFGTALSPDGRPLPGATVEALGPWSGGALETVDARGAYEIHGLAPGEYVVVARAPGLAPTVVPGVTIDRRTEAPVDLVLRPGARIVGRLLGEGDRAVAGRAVLNDLDGRPVPRALADRFAVESGADGRFAVEAVPLGEHVLGASASGLAGRRVEVAVRASDRQVDVGDVRLEAGLAIRGRVQTNAGRPIADALVRASGRRGHRSEARSEANGTFVLAGLDAGTHHVAAETDGYAEETKTAEAGGAPLVFVLSPAGVITGRVVDDRGPIVDGFHVTADTGGDFGRGRRVAEAGEPGGDGSFRLPALAAGTYALAISAPERVPASVPGVAVAAGQVVDVGDVKLSSGGIVRGTVVDASGSAVSGATIDASMGGRGGMRSGDVTTDASGAFELKGMPPGEVQLGARHPNWAMSERVAVEVDLARPVTDVRLVLPAGGRIEGSVRKRDGSGRAGFSVSAMPSPGARIVMTPSAIASTTTADDGTFVLQHVPAGQATVTATPRGGGAVSTSSMRTVDVREGGTTVVEIVDRDILLSGRVTRAGAPGAGLLLRAHSARGGSFSGTGPGTATEPQRLTAVTREDGSFEMLLDEPGSFSINATTADGTLRLPSRRVDVPDVEAHAVELAYDTATVTGIVVDETTDAAVAHASIQATPRESGRGAPSHARAGADGRFLLELEPADYALSASHRDGGYRPAEVPASVGPSGLSDVRLALPKGARIIGAVRQTDGQPAVDVFVSAAAEGRFERAHARSRADGSFEIEGLDDGTYTMTAQRTDGAFALQRDVRTGGSASLSLRPGGRLQVTVKGATGAPVPDAWVAVTRVDGITVGSIRPADPTDGQGRAEIVAPSGVLTVTAGTGYGSTARRRGNASVTLQPGQTAGVDIELRDEAPPAP